MAKITFTIPSVLNSGGGEKKLNLDVSDLTDAFAQICKSMGEDFERRVMESPGVPRSLINVYINGKNSKFGDGLKSALADGDEVYVLPAVAGGEEMSAKEMDRYSRQIMLEEIGYNGQMKLRSARVCVIGTGGLGHPIISRLAAMGIGTLRIIDRDVIELSNLHRQTLFEESDVGKVKVETVANKLKKMNSDCNIEAFPISINDHTALEVIKDCDVVIDALDSVNARYSINRACSKQKIPFVTGAAVGVSGQVFTVMPGESACYHCMFPALDEEIHVPYHNPALKVLAHTLAYLGKRIGQILSRLSFFSPPPEFCKCDFCHYFITANIFSSSVFIASGMGRILMSGSVAFRPFPVTVVRAVDESLLGHFLQY